MSFSGAISEWGKAELERAEAIFHEAAKAVANDARLSVRDGGRMPIDTGTLRRSLQASTTEMPVVADNEVGTGNNVEMVIDGAALGSTVWMGFTVKYALRQEYGFVGEDSLGRVYNQAGAGFVSAAAQKWPQLVTAAEATVRSRFEAGSDSPTGQGTPSV